ncbi:protein transport protein SEC16B homolog [Bidens hawaiensis]|uniref:protein transport protein SEC16B homolog n=1 Tax=Bidens hawaiensis TaxID=980011 RepID=UPI00404A4375
MACSNPPPPPPSFMVVEDTDEDFFDKLVNDDVDSNPPLIEHEFANPILSLSSNSLTDNANATLHLDKPPTAAAVKEVQWSSFGADAAFFDEFGDGLAEETGKGEDGVVSSESNGVVQNNSLQGEDANHYSQSDTGEEAQDPNATQYWENLYPGWRYDANTGQWYQLDNATLYHKSSEFSYVQQSVVAGTMESVTSWDSVSQSNWNFGTQVYPPHMIFDPQYPGWYYDMNAQEWRSLDDYNSQAAAVAHDPVNQNGFGSSKGNTYYENDQKTYSGQEQDYNWNGSFSNTGQQGSTMWQPNTVANNAPMENFRNNQQIGNHYGSNFQVDNQHNFYDHVNNGFPVVSGSQPTIPYSQSFNQSLEQSEKMNVQKAYGGQNQLSYLQQPVHSGHQVSYGSTKGRSSADRPPHALVTFGFGGKLIVMKDATSSINASYGGQDSNSGLISVLNLAEVVTGRADLHDYFHNLCQQSFPGPLSAGNAGSKELNKWLDDRITHSQTSDVDYNKSVVLRLLLCLLKIASQHYGKLRSPLGSDTSLKENDAPEVAVVRLFASVKRSAEYNYGAFAHCLQHIPSEVQIREAAAEVQTLLVSGRKQEALLRAQEGHLWGPALVLAAQLGDQSYVDTVKKMALGQLVPGSPLRTLCLLIAGQPADVFAADARTDGGVLGAVNVSQQQPTQGQHSVNGMLDDWEDNLAVIAANRTKDDELVLIHLGDCLWKERSNIIAAHICYLVAEANFEPYSDTARLCLLGADHWTRPRTYASPEAIQRTEVYEYSKMLGSSQFTLLPFQPYKLYYAHMLAEVGRLSDSLKYCQAVTKSIKTGRIPEVDIWRQLVISLEDRIKIHQQGGFSTGKIVGKLLNLFDTTAQRVVGGLPPPVPSTSGGSAQHDHYQQPQKGSRVLTSQSTMAMSSLVPSASMEPINQADGNNKNMMHNRSASEPAFVRSPTQDQDDTLTEKPTESQSKASEKTSTRRGFGLAMFLEKTVGKILPSRQDKQAKLGEANKFYYDEKLKRWVEEGVDPSAEEATIAPPPTMAAFQNGSPDYSLKTILTTESTSPSPASHTSGIPLIPPTTNQFSARARTAPRARYVDTFNKGGGNQANLFQSPSVPTINRPNPNPNFFVPTAAPAASEQPADTQTPPLVSSTTSQSAMSIQKFASMNDMSKGGSSSSLSTSTSSNTNHPISRRTSSWSGGAFMPNKTGFTHSSNEELQEVEL